MAEEQTVDHATESMEEEAEKTFSQEEVTRISTKEHKSGTNSSVNFSYLLLASSWILGIN